MLSLLQMARTTSTTSYVPWADHVAESQARARKYLKDGDVSEAVSSLVRDLVKHPEYKMRHPIHLDECAHVVRSDDAAQAELLIELAGRRR